MSVTSGLHEDGKLPALELSNRAASGGDPRSPAVSGGPRSLGAVAPI